jgi:hypothetical protein
MVNITKVKRGLANFADREILAKIPGGTLKKTAIGTMMGLYIKNAEKALNLNSKNVFISALGIVDENGDVDVDTLAEEIKKNISENGLRIDIDIFGLHLGDMTLRAADIDMMRTYISNA